MSIIVVAMSDLVCDKAWLSRPPIAHRGLHSPGIPENTLGAFAAAAEAGYGIELDVHLSADGQVVVFHDYRLDRLTDSTGLISQRTAAELAALKIAGTDYTIPTLSEVFDLIAGRVGVLIEIKTHDDLGELEERIAELVNSYQGEVAVQSFNPAIVAMMKRLVSCPVGQVSWSYSDHGDDETQSLSALQRFAFRNLIPAMWIRPDFIAYEHDTITEHIVRVTRLLKVELLVWTVTSQQAQAELHRCVDNIIFEHYKPPLTQQNR